MVFDTFSGLRLFADLTETEIRLAVSSDASFLFRSLTLILLKF